MNKNYCTITVKAVVRQLQYTAG